MTPSCQRFDLDEGAPVTPLVDVATVAAYLGVAPGWVYENADILGARRLGSGPKARLRFSLEAVDERLRACSASRGSEMPTEPVAKRRAHHRPRSSLGTNVDLLPIRGEPRAVA